jgi:hypothetical protein
MSFSNRWVRRITNDEDGYMTVREKQNETPFSLDVALFPLTLTTRK